MAAQTLKPPQHPYPLTQETQNFVVLTGIHRSINPTDAKVRSNWAF